MKGSAEPLAFRPEEQPGRKGRDGYTGDSNVADGGEVGRRWDNRTGVRCRYSPIRAPAALVRTRHTRRVPGAERIASRKSR